MSDYEEMKNNIWEESEEVAGEQDGNNDEAMKEAPIYPLCLIVRISAEERKESCKNWHCSVILSFLGRRITTKFLQARLLKL